MVIQLCIDLFVLLIVIYYITVSLHLFGVSIFSEKKINTLKAYIPFYYWLKKTKEPEKRELSFEEKLAEAEKTVQLAQKQVEELGSEANIESGKAKKTLDKAKKVHAKAVKNLELLKQTKF